jgi:amidase
LFWFKINGMDKYKQDAIVAPTENPAGVTDPANGDHSTGSCSNAAAVAGYPRITVPAGISFFGRVWSEPKLVQLAHSFHSLRNSAMPSHG